MAPHTRRTTLKRPACCDSKGCSFLRENLLLFLLLLGLAVGVGMGAAMRTLDPPLDSRQQMYFRFPGDLLMRMLKMLILPLIVSSLVSGLAGLKARASGRLGGLAVTYYMVTTFLAVVIGIVLVLAIRPGARSNLGGPQTKTETTGVLDSFLDLLRNMFPDNLIEACFRQVATRKVERKAAENGTFANNTVSDNDTMVNTMESATITYVVQKEDGMNVLGLVVFSVALGVVLSRLGSTGRTLYEAFNGMAEATMVLVTVVIWYSPVGIMFLVAAEIIRMTDPVAELQSLGLYMATVLAGLAIHGLLVLPGLYLVIVRRNPFRYLYGVLQALVTALGTASSSATLPVTTRCLEENNNIDKRVVRFVLPVGATINMDGTALYEAVAAIFIAQLNGISLNVGQIIAASITATAASIGAASVPQAGIVTMVIVLSALGLPSDDVSKILAVDWLLDRFRTMVNVEGDAIGAGIVYHLSKRQLIAADDAEQSEQEDQGDEAIHLENDQARVGTTNRAFDNSEIIDKTSL